MSATLTSSTSSPSASTVSESGVPRYHAERFRDRAARFAVVVCTFNEGERLLQQLLKMQSTAPPLFDVVIADGPSTDGSTDRERMVPLGVTARIDLEEPGGLSSALRATFSFAMDEGYEGVVILDGHDKDDTTSLPNFAALLDDGYDFVQGSRYKPGGAAINTPWFRTLTINLIHVPFFSLLCRHRFTDTTNGYRGMSRRFLLDDEVNIFRDDFREYELPYYLAWAACRRGFRVTETPVTRRYPETGGVPTKIVGFAGFYRMLKPLFMLALGRY